MILYNHLDYVSNIMNTKTEHCFCFVYEVTVLPGDISSCHYQIMNSVRPRVKNNLFLDPVHCKQASVKTIVFIFE